MSHAPLVYGALFIMTAILAIDHAQPGGGFQGDAKREGFAKFFFDGFGPVINDQISSFRYESFDPSQVENMAGSSVSNSRAGRAARRTRSGRGCPWVGHFII